MSIHVSKLFYYPIKSFPGIACEQLNINSWGPFRDRRLMLVDEQGACITQRQCRIMALISVSDDEESLTLVYEGREISLAWSKLCQTTLNKSVTVLGDKVIGQMVSGEINDWLSQILQRKVNLAYMADDTHRQVDLAYAPLGTRTGFSDGFPFLIVSQESITSLQQELTFELDVRRFRPNIVLSGCDAFSEDEWKIISINHIEFELVKPCARCIIPSIDLKSGLIQKEVMQVMEVHRKKDNQLYLGQNALHRGQGSIEVGHRVEIIA